MPKNLDSNDPSETGSCEINEKAVNTSQDMATNLSKKTPGVDSKPLSALLTPSFSHLGNYLGDRTKEWVENLEQRRARNTRSHIEAVHAVEETSRENCDPTERQVTLFLEWVDQAGKIDPELEDDIASLWQGILNGIYNNDPDVEELLVLLRQMSRSDARVLLGLPRRKWLQPKQLERGRAEHFRRLGLVVEFSWLYDARQGPYNLLIAMSIIITSLFVAPPLVEMMSYDLRFAEAPVPMETVVQMMQATAAFMVFFILLMNGRHLFSYRLTKLGEKMQISGLKYWKNLRNKPPRKT